MCRWLAYAGSPIFIADLLLWTDHSLIDQSLRARESETTTNGDGFGVGWYAERSEPGLFRDVYPAWNDENLRSLAEQTRSRLFFAHIRAATGTPIQRSNSHPFTHGRWLFQHNGLIPNFRAVKRALINHVDPALYALIQGSTDSELIFHIALSHGLQDDPPAALARTVGLVERERAAAGVDRPLHFSAAVSDGERIWAVRYASGDARPRTLYVTSGLDAVRRLCGKRGEQVDHGVVIASEPLEVGEGLWTAVEPSTVVAVDPMGKTERMQFRPAA